MEVEHLLALFHVQAPSDRVTPQGLAEALAVSPTAAAAIVHELGEQGLVRVTRNADDVGGAGAQATLAATAAGRERLLDEMHRVTGAMHRVLDDFTADERATILSFLVDIAPRVRH